MHMVKGVFCLESNIFSFLMLQFIAGLEIHITVMVASNFIETSHV